MLQETFTLLFLHVCGVSVKTILMFVQLLSDTLFNFIMFSDASCFYEDTFQLFS